MRVAGRQAELGRGEVEQDLARDRPAALGCIAALNNRELFFAVIGCADIKNGFCAAIGPAAFGCERLRDKTGGRGGQGVNSHSLNKDAAFVRFESFAPKVCVFLAWFK